MRSIVPWWAKLSVKVGLGVMRVPYRFAERLQIGRHGSMADASYALAVVRHHLRELGAPTAGFTALELGPGDSVLGAYFLSAFGAGETWLVDVAPFASYSPAQIARAAECLHAEGLIAPPTVPSSNIESFLEGVRAHYLTDGLASLQTIPDKSIDVVWSHAVLEHVRRDQFADLLDELRRVLCDTGRMSHVVDFEDHLDAGFNNLRFSSRTWERPMIWNSGCYTNRLSLSEVVTAMEKAGFAVTLSNVNRRTVPTGLRAHLALEFQPRSDDDLSVAAVDLLATPHVTGAEPHDDVPEMTP